MSQALFNRNFPEARSTEDEFIIGILDERTRRLGSLDQALSYSHYCAPNETQVNAMDVLSAKLEKETSNNLPTGSQRLVN